MPDDLFGVILGGLGLILFIKRSHPWGAPEYKNQKTLSPLLHTETRPLNEAPLITIVVPVRNEAHRVLPLLNSLKSFQRLNAEILIIDDHSTDGTEMVVCRENVPGLVFLKAPLKPEAWLGKSWACHYGAEKATSDYILFTDADTVLDVEKTRRALKTLINSGIDLISSIPYHLTPTWWERLLGPFHVLTLSIIRAFESGVQRMPSAYTYGIGQYLLFKKSTYFAVGGHRAVSSATGEDIALVRLVLNKNYVYLIWNREPLYKVRMFSSFKDFWSGWLRLQAVGLKASPPRLTLEAILIQCGWYFVFYAVKHPVLLPIPIGLAAYLAFKQTRVGDFSALGALLYPLSQALFIALSVCSIVNLARRRGKVLWRDRLVKA